MTPKHRSSHFQRGGSILTSLLIACNLVAAGSRNDLTIKPADDPNVVGVHRAPANPAPVSASRPAGRGAELWRTDYAAALEEAASSGKRVLLNFTGSDWCSWCHKLEADVFGKAEFTSYAAQNFVLVKLDFPRKTRQPAELAAQNKRLQQHFGVRGFPTNVVVDAKGKKLAEVSGYVAGGPRGFLNALNRQMPK